MRPRSASDPSQRTSIPTSSGFTSTPPVSRPAGPRDPRSIRPTLDFISSSASPSGASSSSAGNRPHRTPGIIGAPAPLTREALSLLAEAEAAAAAVQPHRPIYPYPFAHHSFPIRKMLEAGGTGDGRQTPSTTTVSETQREGEHGIKGDTEVDEETRKWAGAGVDVKGKGKGREMDKGKGKAREDGKGMINELPEEILSQIFDLLDPPDLLSTLKVSKLWCLSSFPLLWARPNIESSDQLASLVRVLLTPTPRLTLPYHNYIRRLALHHVARDLTDDLFIGLGRCSRAQRLSMPGASRVSSHALRSVISKLPNITVVDLPNTPGTDGAVLSAIGESCHLLQGLNLTRCKDVDVAGMEAVANGCRALKRVKLIGCHRLTDLSIARLVMNCPQIMELDLSKVPQITDAGVQAIWLHCVYLRELKLMDNITITHEAFIDLVDPDEQMAYSRLKIAGLMKPIVPITASFEHLRVVDLTGCIELTDKAVKSLVRAAPKIRDLTLGKCTKITDVGVEAIGGLGKYLHQLHLGHLNLLTDYSISKLVRSCVRLRYLDVGGCPLLTNTSVFEIAIHLVKIRRLGLVKMVNLTDDGLCALAERSLTLERLHLSYCNKISVLSVQYLLNCVPGLTHMSLTSVKAFRNTGLRQFSKIPPKEFNDQQRASFCVYSGHNIVGLRNWLNTHLSLPPQSDPSSRRNSASSASSVTAPGNGSPNEYGPVTIPTQEPTSMVASAQHAVDGDWASGDEALAYANASGSVGWANGYNDDSFGGSVRAGSSGPGPSTRTRRSNTGNAAAGDWASPAFGESVYRRVSTPTLPNPPSNASRPYVQGSYTPTVGPLEGAFASVTANFLNGMQDLHIGDRQQGQSQTRRDRGTIESQPPRAWSRMRTFIGAGASPGPAGLAGAAGAAHQSTRDSRASSMSSVGGGGMADVPARRPSAPLPSTLSHVSSAADASTSAAPSAAQAISEKWRASPSSGSNLRHRAHTTSSHYVPRDEGRGDASTQTPTQSRSNSSPLAPSTHGSTAHGSAHNRALGGPSSTRASSGNAHALSHPRTASPGTMSQGGQGQYPGVAPETMDRNRARSGSGGSLSSIGETLTHGLRGLRRPSVSQAVSAAVGEGSPLRWVAEMVGWNPEDGQGGSGSASGSGSGSGSGSNATATARRSSVPVHASASMGAVASHSHLHHHPQPQQQQSSQSSHQHRDHQARPMQPNQSLHPTLQHRRDESDERGTRLREWRAEQERGGQVGSRASREGKGKGRSEE